MRYRSVVLAASLVLLPIVARAADADVTTTREDWRDAARDRVVPVKIYAPTESKDPLPILVMSHGLGGSREALSYLGQYWAAHGYFCIVLQHAGSDESLYKGVPLREGIENLKAAMTLEQLQQRCRDVSFAIDELARLNADKTSPLFGRLDLDRIAMAGHSFGAVTTQFVCGEFAGAGGNLLRLDDPRIKAGIALSPSPPSIGDAKTAFAGIHIPMSFWTGTADTSPITPEMTAERRLEPFAAMSHADAYLVVIEGGTHMLFGGAARGLRSPTRQQQADLALIQQGTTAFLDAYLKGDADALHWLQTEQATALGDRGTFQMKQAQ